MYTAIGDKPVLMQGNELDHMELRKEVVDFMREHPDDFAPYIEDDEDFSSYCSRMSKVSAFHTSCTARAFNLHHHAIPPMSCSIMHCVSLLNAHALRYAQICVQAFEGDSSRAPADESHLTGLGKEPEDSMPC